MKKTTSLMVLIAGLLLAGASTAAAQTPLGGKLFVGVNGGVQTRSVRLTTAAVSRSSIRPPPGRRASRFRAAVSSTSASATRSGADFGVAFGYSRSAGRARWWARPRFRARSHSAGLPTSSSDQRGTRGAQGPQRLRGRDVVLPGQRRKSTCVAIGPSFTRVQAGSRRRLQAFRQNLVSAAAAGTTPRQSSNAIGNRQGHPRRRRRPVHVHADGRRRRLRPLQRRIGGSRRGGRREGRRTAAGYRSPAAILIHAVRGSEFKIVNSESRRTQDRKRRTLYPRSIAGRSPARRGSDRRTRCPASSARSWSAHPTASCRCDRRDSRCARPRSCIPSTGRCSRRRS